MKLVKTYDATLSIWTHIVHIFQTSKVFDRFRLIASFLQNLSDMESNTRFYADEALKRESRHKDSQQRQRGLFETLTVHTPTRLPENRIENGKEKKIAQD